MKDCKDREKNKKNCPCTKTDCDNHGICCECIANHREKGNKPACMR